MADKENAEEEVSVLEDSPGMRLKEARKACDKTLADVSKELRLDRWMLEAIERDDFSALGAPVFAKGHLRQYAKHLNIDPDDLMVGYYQVCGSREQPPLLAESMLTAERGIERSFAWVWPTLIAIGVICAIGLGIYWFMQPADEPTSVRGRADFSDSATAGTSLPIGRERAEPVSSIASTPEREKTEVVNAAEDSPTPDSSANSNAALPATGDSASTSSGSATTNIEPIAASVAEPGVSGGLANRAATGASSAEASSDSAQRGPRSIASKNLTITLRFAGESWAEIYDGRRQKLLYGMVQSATVKYLSGPPPISVFLGRQNAVNLEVNGEPYGIPVSAVRGNTARFQIDRP